MGTGRRSRSAISCCANDAAASSRGALPRVGEPLLHERPLAAVEVVERGDLAGGPDQDRTGQPPVRGRVGPDQMGVSDEDACRDRSMHGAGMERRCTSCRCDAVGAPGALPVLSRRLLDQWMRRRRVDQSAGDLHPHPSRSASSAAGSSVSSKRGTPECSCTPSHTPARAKPAVTERHEPWTAKSQTAPEATRNDAFGGFVNRRMGVRISPSAPILNTESRSPHGSRDRLYPCCQPRSENPQIATG